MSEVDLTLHAHRFRTCKALGIGTDRERADHQNGTRKLQDMSVRQRDLPNGHSKTSEQRKRFEPRDIRAAPGQRPARLPMTARPKRTSVNARTGSTNLSYRALLRRRLQSRLINSGLFRRIVKSVTKYCAAELTARSRQPQF